MLDFMKDYDKLRSGRILKTSFRRALDLCGFELTESQTTALEQRYVLYSIVKFRPVLIAKFDRQ